jgi:hypothetical protein
MQEPSYPGKITQYQYSFNNDPNNNSDIQRFSHHEITMRYQYLTGTTILIPMGRFFDTIMDVVN